MENNRSKLIGEILVEKAVITVDQLESALEIQKKEKGYLCDIVVRLGFAKHQDIFQILADHLGVKYVDLKNTDIDTKAVEKVPPKYALHYTLMPYKLVGNNLSIALSDPLDIHKLDDLQLLLDVDVHASLAYEKDISECIQKYYGVGAETLDAIISQSGVDKDVYERSSSVEDLEEAVADASIIKFVNQIFTQAVEERATDIHIEPFANELRVRFRIDGFLYQVPIPESIRLFQKSIVSRIKIMSELDIAEHRLPQDGRIKIKVKGVELDLRISILPSSFGEAVQIRILRSQKLLDLDNLGLLDDDYNKLVNLINCPHGIIFVTGPTGSGKSTTLYSALNRKNAADIKIITTEDPVEYQISGITQVQINPKVGLTFAEVLRSILRHDPDVVMVGEVRDVETAGITIRSAMTGHLVFSTLHTNDAASSPMRLIDMGIEPFLVGSSVVGIIAQRLVRVICPACKKKITVNSDIFKSEGIDIKKAKVDVYQGKGCPKCRMTGFKGRTAIFEILVVDDQIRDMILKRQVSQVIKEKAVSLGMCTLRKNGLLKVLDGITTVSEVLRVA